MTDTEATSGARLEIDGPVARITLMRPATHNALEAGDVAAIHDYLGRLEADGSVRVLILTGTGDQTFCAGASLTELESGELTEEMFEALASRLADFPLPTICALNGSAYGGGVELALCCDFRIGVSGSRFSIPAARLGLCYPLAGLTRFVARLGLAPAQRIFLAAEELEASDMLRVGFLTQLVPRGELTAATAQLAERLAGHAPLAVRAMKRILNQAASGAVDVAEAEARIAECASSQDLREGLRAKREGRPPTFEGR